MSKTIYFIRQVESIANAGGVTMEHKLIPLSDQGRQQTQLVEETLTIKPSEVIVSELVCTQ